MLQGSSFDLIESRARGAAMGHAIIRDRVLPLEELVTPGLIDDPAQIERWRIELHSASPFPHLVIDGLFNEILLDCAAEEFVDMERGEFRFASSRQAFSRSVPFPELGPAEQLYFGLIHSARFVRFLSEVTGIENLIVDSSLQGGGQHSMSANDRFAIHVDFNNHKENGLVNRFILLTYLNRDWRPEYNGDLELWDIELKRSTRQVAPIFGRTVLMLHGPANFHGVPKPLAPPPGRKRRALAAYFYTNERRAAKLTDRSGSVFVDMLGEDPRTASAWKRAFSSKTWRGKAMMLAEQVVPPVLWPVTERVCGAVGRASRGLR